MDKHVRFRRDMLLQPPHHVAVDRVHQDQEIAGLCQASHGQVRLDRAAFVQPLGVHNAAHRHRHIVGADAVQDLFRIPALHEEFGHVGQIHQDGVFPRCPVLLRGILEPVLPSPGVLDLGLDPLRREPIGVLPPDRLAKVRPGSSHAVVHRRPANVARRLGLQVGPATILPPEQLYRPIV